MQELFQSNILTGSYPAFIFIRRRAQCKTPRVNFTTKLLENIYNFRISERALIFQYKNQFQLAP